MAALDNLRALIERHCVTLRVNTETIRGLLDTTWRGGPASIEASRQAVDLAHQMAGAGGSIGFREVSVAAKTLETRLKPLLTRPATAVDQMEAGHLFADLQTVVAGIAPEKSSLYNVNLSQIGGARPA